MLPEQYISSAKTQQALLLVAQGKLPCAGCVLGLCWLCPCPVLAMLLSCSLVGHVAAITGSV